LSQAERPQQDQTRAAHDAPGDRLAAQVEAGGGVLADPGEGVLVGQSDLERVPPSSG